ncbi:hypothetical protein Trco_000247 [Trichoderma cornu-damae]|uniref:Uncharacterized protein n=1 Tax=Trichoderma cornu-damae TaxID=654480 RepID=A0A9P8QX36_9HYPO|nr:hypothetical protein Trco_000247 [Trichoderma cornu-damae]
MASSRQLMKWSPQVHEDILISMFYNLALSAEDWTKVMADLKAMGYTFTESALRQAVMAAPKSANATPSGKKPTRGWDAAAHEALLLCVIEEVKGGKAFLTEVTRRMQARGYSYSYDAINQHVQKLRKNRDTNGIVTATDPGAGGSKASTPRKTATPRKRRTPSKREAAADEEDDGINFKLEDFDDDKELQSPSVRPSKRVKSAAS